jgi:hypothetical protein
MNSSRSSSTGAVFPRVLESNANAAVGMLFEALKGERRSCDVAARDSTTAAVEALAVATVHRDGGVDVYATGFGEGRRTRAAHKAERANKLGGQTARRAEQLNVGSGRAVA